MIHCQPLSETAMVKTMDSKYVFDGHISLLKQRPRQTNLSPKNCIVRVRVKTVTDKYLNKYLTTPSHKYLKETALRKKTGLAKDTCTSGSKIFLQLEFILSRSGKGIDELISS